MVRKIMVGKKLYYSATNIPEFIDSMVLVLEQVDILGNGTPVYLCENKDEIKKKVAACNLSEIYINIKSKLYNADYIYLPCDVPRFKTEN